MPLLSVAIVLFLIMDPIGNISSYLSLMRGLEPKKQHRILLREMLIAVTLMVIFNYIGEYIFQALEISEITVRLASGLILFIISINILFPKATDLRSNLPKGEPFIIPLAIPLIAGPSLLATIMLYAHLEPSQPLMLAAIALSSLGTLTVLFLSPYFHRFLGNNGLLALEKLMGMVLVLLAVQRFAEGLQQFFAQHG